MYHILYYYMFDDNNPTQCQQAQADIPTEPAVKPPTPNYSADTPYEERYKQSFWKLLAELPRWKRDAVKGVLVTGELKEPSQCDRRLCNEFAKAVVAHAELE